MSQNVTDAKYVAGRDINFYEIPLSEVEKQSLFYRATGISCNESARIQIERLISDFGFTNKEVYIAWQGRILIYDVSNRRIVVNSINFFKYVVYVSVLAAFLMLILTTVSIFISFDIHKFPESLILFVLMLGNVVATYIVLRYVITPVKLVKRLNVAVNQLD